MSPSLDLDTGTLQNAPTLSSRAAESLALRQEKVRGGFAPLPVGLPFSAEARRQN